MGMSDIEINKVKLVPEQVSDAPSIPINEVELTPEQVELRETWEAETVAREIARVEMLRQAAYQAESDPLFFKYQRSEDGITKAAWLAKIEEIRERYPMPEDA